MHDSSVVCELCSHCGNQILKRIKMSRIYDSLVFVLMAVVLCVFAIMGSAFLEIEFLEATKGDEFPQILQFENMFYGALNLNIKQFFAFGFYNYGFVYYVLNLLVTAPFFAFDSYTGAIFMSRILQGIFSVLNIFMLYKIAKLFLSEKNAFLLVLYFVSMAGFWLIGSNVKPDFFQSFFILLCAYFLIKDNVAFGKNYTFAIIALGLGVGIAKFQAVMFLPLIFSYIALPCVYALSKDSILKAFKRVCVASVAILCLWIVTNPYLLHPRGFNAWISMFKLNMNSNATNHGAYVSPTLSDKVAMMDFYYFEILIFAFLLVLCVYILVRFLREKEAVFGVFASIVCGFGVSIAYLFMFVNKTWASYYMSSIALGVVILGFGGGANDER